jgi:2-dehydropantoate 2-reductase
VETFTVVGAGGIGCAVGYALRAAGAAVTFVEADRDKVAWGRQHGVAVDRLAPIAADFQLFEDWTPLPGGLVLLCTKCYENAVVLARLPRSCELVPIQNGFDTILDGRHELEGIASFVSECLPHRPHTRITRAGMLHLGFRGSCTHPQPGADRVRRLATLLGRANLFRVATVPDILPYKHTKLMYNAAIGPLAAAAGLDNGKLLSMKSARELFFDLLRENYRILQDAGVRLGTIGPFHPTTVQWILQRAVVARVLSWAFYPSLRGTYCSMHADLPAGQTEIDYYNGYLINLAGERPCPLNRRVYDLVKRLERQRRGPDRSCLSELAA